MNLSRKAVYLKIAKISYLVGSSCLLVGLMLSLAYSPSAAADSQGGGNCDTGAVFKDENAPFEYNGSETITKVIIKAGSQQQGDPCYVFTYPPSNQSNACYIVTGLGTTSVRARNAPDAPSSCHAISHVEFYAGQIEPSPTPTDTPTDTPVPTDTPTDTPVPTDTPTDTPVPTDTPTDTPVPTDTATPVATDPVVTITPTDTPIPTATDPANTEVPPTDPPPTATDPAPTNTPPATLPPPDRTPTQQVLIPETGIDLSLANRDSGVNPWFFLFLGLGMLGVGMIFHGIASRKS